MRNFFMVLGFLVAFGIGFTGHLDAANAASNNRAEALSKITKTMAIVEKYYVDDLNFTDITNKTISGLLNNLDAHSGYLNEKDYKDVKVQMKGEFGGLGITIGMKDGAITVISPIDNTPAAKAGIKAGDIILRINGESTIGMNLDEAVNRMRGEPKSSVQLTIVRKNEKKPMEFNLTREIIKVDSVTYRQIPSENVLYVRVSTFDENVEKKVKDIIEKNKNAKGIILDLRNNPGGLLNQAVDLTNLFVDKGVIVSQKGRKDEQEEIYEAKAGKKITDLPLVVLVNDGSASASEIVSGALQDLKRAVIIGQKTFGKGSVQTVIKVDDKEAIRLTVARYYLPSGRTIQAIGVEPDIVVYPGKVPNIDSNGFSLKESDLKKHLKNELEKVETKKQAKVDEKNVLTQEQIYEDIQLKTAIDTIKVLQRISNIGEENAKK